MATRRYVEELEYADAKGLDTASPINLVATGYVREAKNVNLGTTGSYIKRDGYVNQFTQAQAQTGFSVLQGVEFKSPLATEKLLYMTNVAAAKFGKINLLTGAFSELTNFTGGSLGLSPNFRPSFAQINDTLFYFDGTGSSYVPFAYEANGAYTRPMGIAAPTALSASAVVGSGLEEGDYIYAHTYAFYFGGQLIAESSPSPLAEVSTTSTNKQVDLTLQAFPSYLAAGYSHLVIKHRIFRTVVNGSILFLETEILGNLLAYSSTASDDALDSEQMSFDNSQLSGDYLQSKFPVVARNRLILFHPTQNKGIFSKIGFNGPLPESFPVINEFSIGGKFGNADSLVGAGQIKGVPIILKERSIGRLEEIGLPDLGNSADNITYMYREISDVTGAVSHHAQCQVYDELIFLGRDNVYATDGQNVRPIATQIQNLVKNADYSGTKASRTSAINDTKNRRIYIQVFKEEASSIPDLTLVGDYQQYPQFRWTTYDEGPNDTLNPGLRAGCFFQTEATANGGLDVYFGYAGTEGQYYKMNTGTADYLADSYVGGQPVGRAIYMRLVSKPYMFSQPMITKLYKKAKIFALAQDSTYQFEFGAQYDLNDATENLTSFTIFGAGTTWDDYNWANNVVNPLDLIWQGSTLQEKVYHLHNKAEMMQLVFIQDDANAPLTLLGWGVSGSIFSGL
jgi:hypothetical protein